MSTAKWWWGIFLVGVLAGCGPKDPHDARFKGTWTHAVLNGFTNAKEEDSVTVSADHDRFRISHKSAGGETIEIFDGQTLYSTYVYAASESPGASAFGSERSSPTVTASPMTVTQTGTYRFWSSTYANRHGEPGCAVAGQDTMLYKVGEHRPDGDISEEQWVDAKTGVLLKSIMTIYSSQVRSMVRQETWECQTIDYANVPDMDFTKP